MDKTRISFCIRDFESHKIPLRAARTRRVVANCPTKYYDSRTFRAVLNLDIARRGGLGAPSLRPQRHALKSLNRR